MKPLFSRYSFRRSLAHDGEFLFILGSGRSGNTLLRKILMEKYNIYIPAETYAIGPALDSFRRSVFLTWPEQVRLVLSSFEYQYNFDNISKRGLYQVFQRCMEIPEAKRNFGEITGAMWEFLAEGAGVYYTLPGDKTPYNMMSINLIARAFPNGRYVFITRHPYDVCVSYVKMGRYSDLEPAAHRWMVSHQNWLRLATKFPELKTWQLRYEDLVRNPDCSLSEVQRRLGVEKRSVALDDNVFWGDIDVYDHLSGVQSDVTDQFIGKGARTLSQAERKSISAIVAKSCVRFGYEL